MPELLPFRAVRPAAGKAGLVTSRSYETYGPDALLAALESNPFSFLHIINAGYLPAHPMAPQQRFRKVAEKYREFIGQGILRRDTLPGYYLYEALTPGNRFLGLFGAAGTGDYNSGNIRKHEETISRREAVFSDYLEVVKFNAEPVLLMYPDRPAIKEKLEQEATGEPLYEFHSPEGARHRLWAIDASETVDWIRAEFGKLEAFYIADGHHRCASSSLLARRFAIKNPGFTGREPCNYFMSCLLPESEIRIGSYTRLIKDLNGLTAASFLEKLAVNFRITKLGIEPPGSIGDGQFLMYLENSFFLVARHPDLNTLMPNALERLDAYILYSEVLRPILDIRDLRNEKRIRYGYGREMLPHMKGKVDNGEFRVGFAMKPVTVTELKAIADAGLAMPPKTTYIEPKMLSGLAIYEL
jgi:uncharacterized protein (DUF1015 family)